MKVKTPFGELDCPDKVSDRTKFWTEATRDLARVEEHYAVMEYALREAYNAGRLEALFQFAGGKSAQREVVDADFRILPTAEQSNATVANMIAQEEEVLEQRSPMEKDNKELLYQGELAEAESLGSPVAQADGDGTSSEPTEPGTSGGETGASGSLTQ